ncbi:MAG: hypothetical protein QM764_04755 [Chitinophagaceae bacterium]
MIIKRVSNIFLLMLLSCCAINAQQFKNSATLDTVKQDGFYSIPVTPQLSSYLKNDFSDIRIADEKGEWVPHIVRWPLKNVIIESLISYLPILSKEKNVATTTIIAKNIGKESITNLILGLKNSAATRTVIVSGSDDQVNWFAITDSLVLKPETIIDEPAVSISFPVVNYNFFKIVLFNNRNDPYNIKKIMTEGPAPVHDLDKKRKFITNPPLIFNQSDSANFSLLRIENPEHFHIDKLIIHVASPHFFDRRATLFIGNQNITFHAAQNKQAAENIILSSAGECRYNIKVMNDSILYLLIENRDNPPLKIDSVVTEQTSRELVAYLEKRKQYKILFNDPDAKIPDYDLQKFQNSIPDSLPNLSMGIITTVEPAPGLLQKHEKNFWQQWMWPVIILVLIILLYFTFSLIRDVRKAK